MEHNMSFLKKLGLIVASSYLIPSMVYAITWGQEDGAVHTNVVQLLFEQGEGGFFTCTGTLLNENVVLTAGHCTEGAGEPNLNTWVKNDDLAGARFSIFNDLNLGVCFDDEDNVIPQCFRDAANNSPDWTSAVAIPHPDFDDFAAFPDTYDVGVALLADPIIRSMYGTLPELGALDRLAERKGKNSSRSTVVVGYGSQGTIPAFADPSGSQRIVGTVTMQNINNSITGDQSVQLSNNPGKGNGVGGTCFGDSGGPAFLVGPKTGDETNVIGSVTSFGISGQCAGRDFNFRMDTETAIDFVNGILDDD
jgi:hypothetical protein